MAAPPKSRSDFEIAIVCALVREFDAVDLLVDQYWDENGESLGKANGDPNTYTTGRIGNYNVVMLVLPGMGKVSAASAAASLRSSYPRLKLVLLTGVCGGVPHTTTGEDIILGDVIISKTVVQYDFGRQYSDDFVIKNSIEDSLGRPDKNVRNLVTILETRHGRERLQERTAYFLREFQNKAAIKGDSVKYRYPGAAHDKLFPSSYRHKHQDSPKCICANSHLSTDPVCEQSRKLSCNDVGCDEAQLVQRQRVAFKQELERNGRGREAEAPFVFVGRIGSADQVVKSGEDRDKISKCHGLLAFEMESAGVWDEIPCIMVKSVCDYSDSHKNKGWQDWAAATAASSMKALLERYMHTDLPMQPSVHSLNNTSSENRKESLSELHDPKVPKESPKPSSTPKPGDSITSALHLAVWNGRTESARQALETGADVDVMINGTNPLHIAAEHGRTEIVLLLLEYKANIEAKSMRGTPLHKAAFFGHIKTVEILLQHGADVTARIGVHGDTPLSQASRRGNLEVIQLLQKHGADIEAKGIDSWTPLHQASYAGRQQVVQYLVECGVDVNAKTRPGSPPLYKAAEKGHDAIMRILIANGADLEAADVTGWTPLHQAVHKKFPKAVLILLENKANLEAKDKVGATALYKAVQVGSYELARLLVEKGADVNNAKNDGWMPLNKAAYDGKIQIVDLLLEFGAAVEAEHGACASPLYSATEKGYEDVVLRLLNRGANPNKKLNLTWTPLHKAAQKGYLSIVQIMLENNASLEAKNNNEETPLHIAAINGQREVVQFLLAKGASTTAETVRSQTPAQLAAKKGHNSLVQLLQSGTA